MQDTFARATIGYLVYKSFYFLWKAFMLRSNMRGVALY